MSKKEATIISLFFSPVFLQEQELVSKNCSLFSLPVYLLSNQKFVETDYLLFSLLVFSADFVVA